MRHAEQIGSSGSSWISQPATTGRCSSSSDDERAQDAALRLAAQAEQDEVVPRQHRVDELRNDGVVVADDAGKQRLAAAELRNEVVAHFVLHRSARKRLRRRGAGAAQIAERLDGRDRWHVAILSQLESRGASGDSFVAAPRLRASRRQQDWPGKHDRGVRSRAGGRRRRPRARRPPLARRHRRRPSRRDARSHHARNGAARAIGPPPSSQQLDVPPLRDVLARYPQIGIIIELKERRARRSPARSSTRCAAPAPSDRVCLGSFSVRRCAPRARRRPTSRRAAPGSKCGWRCTDRGAASRRAACRIRRFRFPKPAARRASSRRDSSSSRTKPASPCRCGRWTSRRTYGGCSIGAWTASSRTGRTLRRRWSRTGVAVDSRRSQSAVVESLDLRLSTDSTISCTLTRRTAFVEDDLPRSVGLTLPDRVERADAVAFRIEHRTARKAELA